MTLSTLQPYNINLTQTLSLEMILVQQKRNE